VSARKRIVQEDVEAVNGLKRYIEGKHGRRGTVMAHNRGLPTGGRNAPTPVGRLRVLKRGWSRVGCRRQDEMLAKGWNMVIVGAIFRYGAGARRWRGPDVLSDGRR